MEHNFLRTTASESFGENACNDWRIGTNETCGFDIYRKATSSLGVLYDGNVVEFKDDGDVNITKEGGLFVNGNEVATESYVDNLTDVLSSSVSELITTTIDHGGRIASIEGAGYVPQSP